MKVLHCIRKKSQLKATFISNQIDYLDQNSSYVVYRFNSERTNSDAFSDYNYKGKELDLSVFNGILEKILYWTLKTISRRQRFYLEEFIDTHNIDLCHFHYGSDAGVFYPIQKRIKIPTIVSFYGYDCFSFPRRFFGLGKFFLKKRVFRPASGVLAMSGEMKNDLLLLGCPENKIFVHYHGIPSKLKIINRDYQIGERVNLLMLSYLDPVKGHLFVLQALRKLISSGNTNFYLKIYGSGHYLKTLESAVTTMNLSKYVEFAGAVKYMSPKFQTVFSKADIYLHTSVITKHDKEGIPGSLVEAMFAGLPIIATRHGGIPYVIEDGKSGLLIDEWDIEELGNALTILSQDEIIRRRLGETARHVAMQQLDIKLRSKNLESIYKSLLR